jgi:hypothetical protein
MSDNPYRPPASLLAEDAPAKSEPTLTRKFVQSLLVGLVSLVAIIILHQRSLSLQTYLIGDAELLAQDMATRKFLIGLLTSLLVVAICKAIIRRASLVVLVLEATAAQILWLEVEYGFYVPVANLAEFFTRFAEEAGVLLSAALLIAYSSFKHRPPVRAG